MQFAIDEYILETARLKFIYSKMYTILYRCTILTTFELLLFHKREHMPVDHIHSKKIMNSLYRNGLVIS